MGYGAKPRIILLLYLPECHPFPMSVRLCVLANKGTLAPPLETEEQIGMYLEMIESKQRKRHAKSNSMFDSHENLNHPTSYESFQSQILTPSFSFVNK